MSSLPQAFPETATVILCVCQHAELSVSLAGHHRAHPAQPIARNPLRGAPQAPRPLRSTGSAITLSLCLPLSFLPLSFSLSLPFIRSFLIIIFANGYFC